LNNKKNITIVGLGYVGCSLAVLLAQKNNVIALDTDQDKVNSLNKSISPIEDNEITDFLNTKKLNLKATTDNQLAYINAEYVVICTPTNFNESSNSFNTSIVDDVIKSILGINPDAFIIIKSTLPIGHTKAMQDKFNNNNITFSPEFLREGNALHDNLNPSRIVIGTRCEKSKIFVDLLKMAANSNDSINTFFVSTDEAEAIKLFSNTYLATRISFFNELDTFAQLKGLNTKNIIEGVCSDNRIGNFYNNPSFGYGGYCLPKDTKQLRSNFKDIPQSIIDASIESNRIRKEFIANQVLLENPKIVGIYRLSMKKNSDNFRTTAVESVIEILLSKGIQILIYEPLIMERNNYKKCEIVRDLKKLKDRSDIILANRNSEELDDVKSKVFSNDIFGSN
tara:strand:- start:22493 stop:23677 length:1185 start_codon:yes stop_codon:yes gene_type:complete